MYKCLRKIGMKRAKAPENSGLAVRKFKEHFERVSNDRYEEDPNVIARLIERVNDLREDERERNANDELNEIPERDEIERAMEELKDSSLGKDWVRLRYMYSICICEACKEVRIRVISYLRMMFERRANE